MMTIKQFKLTLVGLFLSIFVDGQSLPTKKQGNKETAPVQYSARTKVVELIILQN